MARVDLKADRRNGILIVQSVHTEPNAPRDTMEYLKEELRRMAKWLGLPSVVFAGGG